MSTPRINIITWMYTHSAGEGSRYPQSGDVEQKESQEAYWKCAFSLFASSIIAHGADPVFRHLLFVNKLPPEYIDGISSAEIINRANIEIVELDIKTQIPKDYFHSVTTQFYLVDLFEQLVRMTDSGWFSKEDIFLVLDGDCLFNLPLNQEFVTDIETHGALTYTNTNCDEASDSDIIYEIPYRKLREIAQEYAGRDLGTFYLASGEFFGVQGGRLKEFASELRIAMDISIDRHNKGLSKFHTEEMLFGYVYTKLKIPQYLGNKYIKRIYTSPVFNTSAESDKDIPIWHLLTEKYGIFQEYFRDVFGPQKATDEVRS